MFKNNFLGTVLVIILGVNVGAWTLSVATSPIHSIASLAVPITPSALDAQSLPAGADTPYYAPAASSAVPTDTAATSTLSSGR